MFPSINPQVIPTRIMAYLIWICFSWNIFLQGLTVRKPFNFLIFILVPYSLFKPPKAGGSGCGFRPRNLRFRP